MNEITCEVCMDLMPLVHDGVASDDSVNAVQQHIRQCPDCQALFEGQAPLPSDKGKILDKLNRKIQLASAMVLMFGVLFGLMLTAGSGIFHNALIMPIIGAIGYYLFRWRALYLIPGILFVTHLVINYLGMGQEVLDIVTLVTWTGLYCIFALIGFVIAALLHFVFRKEDNK